MAAGSVTAMHSVTAGAAMTCRVCTCRWQAVDGGVDMGHVHQVCMRMWVRVQMVVF